MKDRNPTAWIVVVLWCVAALALVACNPDARPPEDEEVGEAHSAVFTNGDFEMGMANNPPQGWNVTNNLNPNGVIVASPETFADLQLAAGGNGLTTTIAAVNQADPDLGATASLRVCRYGNQCARVNFHSSTNFGHGKNVNTLSQTMTIGAGDVDPSDGQVHIRFTIAPVLQNPAHPLAQQPYYFVQLTNTTKGTLLYRDFNLSAQPGVPWKTINGGMASEIDYVDWSLVDIAPGPAALAMGDSVLLQIIAGGCSPGGHFGEVYVDGVGSTVPGLFVSGTGPAQVNPGGNVTYTVNYKNGAAGSQAGVVIDFTTPPGTTFQSFTAPPGAMCVTPAVGMAGTITCTFAAPLPPGATGSFTVTVNVTPGAACMTTATCAAGEVCDTLADTCVPGQTGAACTTNAMCPAGQSCDTVAMLCTLGEVVAGNYDIHSAAESPLLGNKITTVLGCVADFECKAGTWCDESADACTATLPNGTAVPSDPPHTGPTLNGMCTAAAGMLVCTSGVCDPGNSKCGYANGDGPCTAANGDVVCQSAVCDTDMKCGYLNGDGPCATGAVCRSGACDPDMKCGYAVGDGPCTVASGPTVCRSGMCSMNGTCEPSGGCDVDTDCAAGNWCDESAHTCTAQLANGTMLPTDPPHMGPTLDGTCTPAAGMLVCQSGVCDTDNACGFANGDGPCTTMTGPTVCRSGMCSSDGTCEPMGGCDVDADCAAGNWCDEAMHMCTPTLPNGTAIPNDPTHMSPTLNGMCTSGAGMLVCTSGVCDMADDECGYANGDGPCTTANGDVVCRSGTCSTDGTCEAANGCNVDADCTAGNWCDETTHMCTPTLANGMPLPTDPPHANPTLDGTCTDAAGMLVCTSAVCDTADNQCGYANGDGTCTSMTGVVVCRSTVCATSGPNEGKCVACTEDSQCSGSTPICDTATNACVQCDSSSQCMGRKPVCDAKSDTCVPCNGDNASKTSDACPTSGEPFCFLTGGKAGACGKCTADADCAEHSGTTCDTTSGRCVSNPNGFVASGNGLLCATPAPGGGSGDGAAGVVGLMLAAAGFARRSKGRAKGR